MIDIYICFLFKIHPLVYPNLNNLVGLTLVFLLNPKGNLPEMIHNHLCLFKMDSDRIHTWTIRFSKFNSASSREKLECPFHQCLKESKS